MHIQQTNPRSTPTKIERKKKERSNSGGLELAKNELIADIFNNKPSDKEQKKDSKIRLSHTSSALHQELVNEVKLLLNNDKGLAKAVDEIPLPDNGYISLSHNSDLTIRKLSAYNLWLRIMAENTSEEESVEENEELAPFLSLQARGKDNEIKSIYEENQAKRLRLNAERAKDAPNYYYAIYPETYAFN